MNYRLLILTGESLDILSLKAALDKDERVSIVQVDKPEDIWDSIAADSPDLVILDWDMPRAGAEILGQLRKKCIDCATIAITSFATLGGAVEAFRAGAADYLTRPIDPNTLCNRIENNLAQLEMNRSRNETEKQKLIRQLAASINHEINNPLTAILGTAELILGDGEGIDDKIRQDLEIIIEQSLRIREVTARLRDLPEIRLTKYGSWESMIDLGMPDSSSAQSRETDAASRRPTVFFVDDNTLMIAMLQRTFMAEMDLRSCATGQAALDGLLAGERADALFVDLALPDMDALSLVAKILGSSSPPPVFLLAPYHDEEKITKAMDIGAAGVLYKPLHLEDFKKTVLEIAPRKKTYTSAPTLPSGQYPSGAVI